VITLLTAALGEVVGLFDGRWRSYTELLTWDVKHMARFSSWLFHLGPLRIFTRLHRAFCRSCHGSIAVFK